ncbi:hypothetical protein TrCOL_g8018 [Triparma columacea]|uniref:Vacuolar protein-sorting-associated protein 36 n=1 Tax=Triparma columacea TaxID=722753 RepID=A0A9W7G549_9STRA|nr:hypothetical protein TrCOL_g8018 [Triparma columacea]
MLGRNPKVSFVVDNSGSGWVTPLSVEVVEGGVKTVVNYLDYGGEVKGRFVLKFENTDKRDAFAKHLTKSLSRRMWGTIKLIDPSSTLPGSTSTGMDAGGGGSTFKSSGAGIGGIIRRRKEKHNFESTLASSALTSDLETLMVKAEEVVKVIERLKSKMKSNGSKGDEDLKAVNELLMGMGMTRGVDKKEVGDTMYPDILAREVCDFLKQGGLLERKGGIMGIMDLYCVYNRARNGDMVSPEDLLEASGRINGVRGGVGVEVIGGVRVVRLDEFDSAKVGRKVAMWSREEGRGMGEGEVGKRIGITTEVARAVMGRAVEGGGLVVEESIGGKTWWWNRFEEF